ncbi:TPA: hypothetical protein U2I11_002439 [Citrobacter koseri]|uniref:hypothetical protein n=1 Tax=Citrobacter koseri TaxID=545 RepID=UPI000BBD1A49|nr:hypothetical protein [Citrobacter koseri]ATF98543.1 hypothetical protein CO700_16560 [Citrobacter koseri]MBJ8916676.1 hypothetical protein [Citrobacter koseri]MBJ8950271.1 hypothetical protein [Citrobacter koseri]MBJ9006455.1 hypothetical protein [Citrobacter koseri]HEM6721536.1 hypothetical protein [Citrobacter koseri]
MKKIALAFSLVFVSAFAQAKTVSDFINEHPELAKSPTIKAAIQQGAMGNAGIDALSNGSSNQTLGSDTQKLLAENGYEYAQAGLRDLATSICGENGLADVYGLRKKDCDTIIKVDSEIE